MLARREELGQQQRGKGWSQTDLAKAAGVVRSTVQLLEDGKAIRLGKEGAIERALGWTLGSIDLIRTGDEPIPDDGTPVAKPIAELTRSEVLARADQIAEQSGEEAGDDFVRQWVDARRTPPPAGVRDTA